MSNHEIYDPDGVKRYWERQKLIERSPYFCEERRTGADRRQSSLDDFRLATNDDETTIYHVYGPHGKQERFGPGGTYVLIRPAQQDNDNIPAP